MSRFLFIQENQKAYAKQMGEQNLDMEDDIPFAPVNKRLAALL